MSASATVVHLLCLLASAICAWLLIRSYLRSRAALLLWSAACFALLTLNSFLVVLDLMVTTSVDLVTLRQLSSLAAVSTLLYGFIWELD